MYIWLFTSQFSMVRHFFSQFFFPDRPYENRILFRLSHNYYWCSVSAYVCVSVCALLIKKLRFLFGSIKKKQATMGSQRVSSVWCFIRVGLCARCLIVHIFKNVYVQAGCCCCCCRCCRCSYNYYYYYCCCYSVCYSLFYMRSLFCFIVVPTTDGVRCVNSLERM